MRKFVNSQRLPRVRSFTDLPLYTLTCSQGLGATVGAITLAWVARNPNTSTVILSVSSTVQLLRNLKAIKVLLPPKLWSKSRRFSRTCLTCLTSRYAPFVRKLNFPYHFCTRVRAGQPWTSLAVPNRTKTHRMQHVLFLSDASEYYI